MADTRVEKYKEYRKEIQNSFSEADLTTKKKTSDRVNKILTEQDKEQAIERSSDSSISYKDLMGAYEMYDKNSVSEVSPLANRHKKKINYIIIASVTIVILIAITIIVGVLTFGGK